MRTLFSALCALAVSAAVAGGEPISTTYSMYSKGMRVGSVRTERVRVVREGRPMVSCRVTTDVNVRIPFFKYSLANEEECLIGEHGAVAYKQVRHENGDFQTISGALEDGVFRFTVSDKDGVRMVNIPRADYAATSMDSLELKLAKPGDEVTLRILDLNLLALVDRRYHWVKNEKIAVGDKSVLSRVVDYADPNKKIRRWVAEDSLGLLIMRQEGREKAGSYSMRMVQAAPRFPAGAREIFLGVSARP